MGLVVVAFSILVLVGAFTWLKPSANSQRLASMRSSALKQGFKLSSIKLPDLSEYGRVKSRQLLKTIYQKPVPERAPTSPLFAIQRTSGEAGAYLPPGWAWHRRANLAITDSKKIAQLASTLPSSVSFVMLEIDAVSLSWDELAEDLSLDEVSEWLRHIADDFSR